MPNTLTKFDLLAELRKQTAALGLDVQEDSQQGLTGEAETIQAKWWLGGRKVTSASHRAEEYPRCSP